MKKKFTPSIVNIHLDHGFRLALVCKEGRKFVQLIWIESSGVKLHALPLTSMRHAKPADYPIRRAARKMLEAGRSLGITKKARATLKQLKTHTPGATQ